MKSSSNGAQSKQSSTKIKYGNIEKDFPKFTKRPGVDHPHISKPSSPTSSPKSKTSKPKICISKAVPKSKQKKATVNASSSTNSNTNISPKNKLCPVTQTSASSSSSSLRRQPVPRKGECEICKQPCRSHCAGCKRVFYCCKQHQQADWGNHKLVCRPFSIPTQYTSGFHLRPPAVSSTPSLNTNFSSVGSLGNTGSATPELQFMMTTKQINAGSLVFSERPLLVTANVLSPTQTGSDEGKASSSLAPCKPICSSCFQPIKPVLSKNESNNTTKVKILSCPKCELPLCHACLISSNNDGLLKNYHPGTGHSPEECTFIKVVQQNSPESIPNLSKLGSNREELHNFLKDLTMLRILMFRTGCLWRWENLLSLRGNPRFVACCKHNFGNMDDWLSGEYPIANNYMKNICKEKTIQLTDIVKICAVFCEKSAQNPNWLLLYENRSWIPHACRPNAEQFYRQTPLDCLTSNDVNQNSLEIIVKAVDNIEEGSKVTTNYIHNFEGGRATLAVRLFQSKGLHCCDSECPCYQRGFDKSLGVRCDLFPNSSGEVQACAGVLCPRVEAPNPEKPNLGLGVFIKSKKWECDKCTKSEKYSVLHPKIVSIAQDLTESCDNCCSNNKNGFMGNSKAPAASYLQLQSKLFSALAAQHWMVWKAKIRIMKAWGDTFGHSFEMLRKVISLPVGSPSRDNLIYMVKQKADIYGGGIYDTPKSAKGIAGKTKLKTGLLEFIGQRHGKLSPRRGEMMLDAFYANLILLIEDYKKELPLSPAASPMIRNQVARENCKKLEVLRDILEKATVSLRICEGTTKMSFGNFSKYLRMANDTLEVLKAVCNQVQKSPVMIIGHFNDLVELYACQDQKFVTNIVKASQPRKDPFRLGVDDLEFETESGNLGKATLAFGVESSASASSSSSFRSSTPSTSKDRFKPNASRFTASNRSSNDRRYASSSSFPFSTGSRFGSTRSPTDSDEDEEENPFVYSRGASFQPRGKKKSSKPTNEKRGSGKTPEDDDWSSYFWFTSDDDDQDDEYDFSFHPSRPPPPRFGEDLFNDDDLDDLAEWAALQFMMGKMKV